MAANQAMRTMNKIPPPSRSKNCTNNAKAMRPSTTSPTRQMLAGLRRTSRMDGGLDCSSAMGRSNRIVTFGRVAFDISGNPLPLRGCAQRDPGAYLGRYSGHGRQFEEVTMLNADDPDRLELALQGTRLGLWDWDMVTGE